MRVKIDNLKAVIDVQSIEIADVFDVKEENTCTVFIRINDAFIKELNGFNYSRGWTIDEVLVWAKEKLKEYEITQK